MSRLPVDVDPLDDVLVGSVVAGVVNHRPAGLASSCGVPAASLLEPIGAYRVVALCGSPCTACWPDPFSSAAVRDRNSSGAAVCGPARTRAIASR